MADQLELPLVVGWHIRCSSSLEYIRDRPEETCVDSPPPGTWDKALAAGNEWTWVSVQPHPQHSEAYGLSTLSDDVSAVSYFASLTRAKILLYETWPPHENFDSTWTARVADHDGTTTVQSAEYFEHLRARLDEQGVHVDSVPVGQALYNLNQALKSHAVPGYHDIEQLYRDEIHLARVGRWVAAVTVLSVLSGRPPSAISMPPESVYSTEEGYPPELLELINAAVEAAIKSR